MPGMERKDLIEKNAEGSLLFVYLTSPTTLLISYLILLSF